MVGIKFVYFDYCFFPRNVLYYYQEREVIVMVTLNKKEKEVIEKVINEMTECGLFYGQ